ncbi:MAG: hypothetical protein LC623_08110 [Halobacteriales archaeon]|nr:hypothetical protein [Halobacteriales archaeon]
MEPHTRKRTILGGAAVVALLAVGLLATQAAGAFGGRHPASSAGPAGRPMGPLCERQELTESNGDVSDGCVSFHVDAASGTVTAYTVKANGTDVQLVDSLDVPALAGGDERARRGYALHKDDVAFLAQGPGFTVMSRNGTALTLTIPAGATVTVHDAVADWSPAGATIAYGTVKASLMLPKGSTLSQSGNTLAIQAGPGPVAFHLGPNDPLGHPGPGFGGPGPHGPGFEGRDPPREGPRDGPRGPPPQ